MLDKLDDLLGALSIFDWITPLAAFIQDLVRGPSFTFLVPHRSGWGIYAVERILKQAGCRAVWGKMIVNNTMMLTVPKDDAQRGYWALYRAGVPMEQGIPRTKRSRA